MNYIMEVKKLDDFKFDWEGDEPTKYNFEWIENGKGLKSGFPFVTISPLKTTNFYINSDAMRLIHRNINAKEFIAVQVGIDIFKGLLAIKPLEDSINGSIVLNKPSKQNSGSNARFFSAPTVISRLETMISSDTKRYIANWNDEVRCLIVDLNKFLEPWKNNKGE